MNSKYSKYIWPAAVIFLIVLFCSVRCFAETLYVFYPTTLSSKAMQTEIKNICPGIDITVFGRYRDFSVRVKEAPPDAILTKTQVVETIENFSVKLNGSRKGSAEEPYVFLSVDQKIDTGSIADITVGVLDILGRKGMTELVGKFFSPPPKIKRVTKMEDLLSLLTFDAAKAILIPEHYVAHFKKISQLNFAITPAKEMKTGIVALAVKNGGSADATVTAIKGMDSAGTSLLEVDNWQ